MSGRNALGGRVFRRPGSLAWAASLTVALTAGWLARGTVGSVMMADRAADRDAAESLEGSVAGEGGDDERGFRSVVLHSTESPSELKDDLDAQVEPPPESFARQATELPEGADRRRGDRVAMDELVTESAGEEAPAPDDRPAPVATALDARRLETGNRELAAQPEPQYTLAPELERAAAKTARPDVAGRPSAGLGAVDGPADWQPVRREQAEALLGGALKTVEGLPVLSVYARAAGAAPEVWTAQQLASGHQLNLRQTPLGGDRFGDLEEGRTENERDEPGADPVSEMEARPQPQQQAYYETLQSLRVDGFLIEARAPLSPDSLRVLLSRLRD